MKSKSLLIIFCLAFTKVFAQEVSEKVVNTEVGNVSVFISGAQINRKATVELAQGVAILKFVNLSPFVDSKSVQVKVDGDVTIQSVNYQQNFIDKLKKSQELIDLETKQKGIEEKIKLENAYLDISAEELAFLQANRDIGGKNQALSVTNLKDASAFYDTKLTTLKLKEIEHKNEIVDLNKEKSDVDKQMNALTSKNDYAKGEILVKVEARNSRKAVFEISYFVKNAGWFPSYDIRAKSITEPLALVYKANVRQDTKVDWKNVKLSFSSADPNVSGVAPELKPYYLDYNIGLPVYEKAVNLVSGKVVDQNQVALAGAGVTVEGTTIGTYTDNDGNYAITIPGNTSKLVFSMIGFKSQTLSVTGSEMNIVMNEETKSLNEVVVTGYGRQRKVLLTGSIASLASLDSKEIMVQSPSPSAKVEQQTTVNFEIKSPYSVKSDNKSYAVDMQTISLPATYQYYCVPKIDKDVFLLANIVDWEKYSLLEGEANLFFEDTYVGKSLLDVRSASDTLQLSLGRDKNVSVQREKVKDYTTKQFLGSKKEDTRDWKTTVRNNKSQRINMLVIDQVPVSTSSDIEVEVQNVSNAQYNKETGEIRWNFTLEPNETKVFDLKYAVKYPKNRHLVIE